MASLLVKLFESDNFKVIVKETADDAIPYQGDNEYCDNDP